MSNRHKWVKLTATMKLPDTTEMPAWNDIANALTRLFGTGTWFDQLGLEIAPPPREWKP